MRSEKQIRKQLSIQETELAKYIRNLNREPRPMRYMQIGGQLAIIRVLRWVLNKKVQQKGD